MNAANAYGTGGPLQREPAGALLALLRGGQPVEALRWCTMALERRSRIGSVRRGGFRANSLRERVAVALGVAQCALSGREIARRIKASRKGVHHALQVLRAKGLAESMGEGHRLRWRAVK